MAYYYWPEKKLPPGVRIDKLVVIKSKNIMMAYSKEKVIKTYRVSIGKNSIGDKQFEGDKRTPEGTYSINDKNPNSDYHKNLGISYPNKNDIVEAKERNVKPGGQIKIHGLKNGQGFIGKFQRFRNWTAGCIAVTNDEVDELYNHVEIGTPVIIKP
jgi:murein L,D-transpeptidase YafK